MLFPSGTPAVPFVLLDSAHPLTIASLAVLELPVFGSGSRPASRFGAGILLAGTRYPYVAAKSESELPDGHLSAWPWYLLVVEGLVVPIVVGLKLPFARLCRA